MEGRKPVMADTPGFNIYANAIYTLLACCTGVHLLQYLYVSPYTLTFEGSEPLGKACLAQSTDR